MLPSPNGLLPAGPGAEGYLAKAAAAARSSNAMESTVDISEQIKDAVNDETFDPSNMNQDTLDAFGKKLDELVAATDALAKQSQDKIDKHAQNPPTQKKEVTLEDLHTHMQTKEVARPTKADLSALPSSDGLMTIFTECDELMVSGDVDSVLLGAGAAASGYANRAARLEALQGMSMPMADAMATLAAGGVKLREDFIEFVEMSSVKRMRVCCLSRGLKPIIRQLLRDEGLGHVEVIAHDMYVERAKGDAWNVCWRDDTPSGHDKAESMRRALQGAKDGKKGKVVLVGRTSCDYAPVRASMVDCLIAPAGSELADEATANGVVHRTFVGWGDLQKNLLGM